MMSVFSQLGQKKKLVFGQFKRNKASVKETPIPLIAELVGSYSCSGSSNLWSHGVIPKGSKKASSEV